MVFNIVHAKINVKGLVLYEQNKPIIGATVQIKENKTQGTVSDYQGKFEITVQSNSLLIVSFVGMITQEVISKSEVVFILKEDDKTKNIIFISLLFIFASCFEDRGNYIYNNISEIDI